MAKSEKRVSVRRLDRKSGDFFWCKAKYKKTARYQDSIAVSCGGFIVLPGGISIDQAVTCPDCLSGRKWTTHAT